MNSLVSGNVEISFKTLGHVFARSNFITWFFWGMIQVDLPGVSTTSLSNLGFWAWKMHLCLPVKYWIVPKVYIPPMDEGDWLGISFEGGKRLPRVLVAMAASKTSFDPGDWAIILNFNYTSPFASFQISLWHFSPGLSEPLSHSINLVYHSRKKKIWQREREVENLVCAVSKSCKNQAHK